MNMVVAFHNGRGRDLHIRRRGISWWPQCPHTYRSNCFLGIRAQCVRGRWHFGEHVDYCGEWKAVGPDYLRWASQD